MSYQKFDGRLCGLGKTTQQHEFINASEEMFLIASPTKALNEEQEKGIKDCYRIDSDTLKKWGSKVKHELEQAMIGGSYKNIAITHSALPGLLQNTFESEWKITANRHLVIDESFDQFCIKELSYKLSTEIYGLLLSMLDFTESDLSSELMDVTVKPEKRKRFVEWSKAQTECTVLNHASPLKAIATNILNPMYRTLMTKAAFEKLESLKDSEFRSSFSIVSILRPETLAGFKSVTHLSAHFLLTEYALIMQAQGVKFTDITPKDTPSTYKNSHRLKLHYFIDRNWTKTLSDYVDEDGKTNIDKAVGWVEQLSDGSPFIFNAHTDSREDIDKLDSATLVKATHGQNNLRDQTKAAFLGIRNVKPQVEQAIKHLGIERDNIDTARTVLTGYQFFMRTDLRNLNSEKPIDLYCCDLRMVQFMKTMFPDAEVIKHDIGIQETKLDDHRINNGGKRENSGRKGEYPNGWSEADKAAWRYYARKGGELLSKKDWYKKHRQPALSD